MTKRPGPSVRRRQLGKMLAELRLNANVQRRDAAEWLGVTEQHMSRIETGKSSIKDQTVRSLCQLYDVEANDLEVMLRLARESAQRGWWSAYRDTLPDWARQLVGQEADAQHFWSYEPEIVPGLLQTTDYVAAINRILYPDMSEAQIARQQELRRERQQRLNEDNPPTLHFYLSEAVVRHVIGNREVMAGQLDYLAEVSRFSHVEIRVVPFAAGGHAAMSSSFVLIQLPEEDSPAFAYVEHDRGATYQENPADIDRYTVVVDLLDKTALDEADSRALIEQATKQLRTE